jgi:apolipoprotein N-acyltransferase
VLAVAFPPPDIGPLAFVALLPLLAAWRAVSPRWAALLGGVFGLAYFGVLLDWARYFGAVAIAPLVIAEAAFVAATGALVAAFARRGFRSPWIVAAVWVVLEGLRARWPLGGLPWGEVGVALHDFPPARALASVGGVPLVSFAVVAANALLLDLLVALRARRGRALLRAGVALLMLATIGAINDVARYEPTVTGRLRFALLQGNDQDRRLTDAEIESEYLTRRHLALAARLRGHYDLVVFPESALENDPTEDHSLRARLVAVGRKHGAVVLANALTETRDGGVANSNLAYTPGGRLEGVYSKQHLVPFGEYVPFRSELGFIGELGQVPVDYEAGHRRVLFRVAGKAIATVICFESAFAPLVRAEVRDGAQAIVVSTNNRSYRRSGLAAQHLALSQMRAAETARPVLHASISGISGVVDAGGGVHDTSRLFVNTITAGTIATTTGETPYVRFGEWVLVLSSVTLVGLAALGAARDRCRAAVNSGG